MSRFPFPPFPNGWFVVAFSDELLPGQVMIRHYFGRDIVLFRTEQGEAHAVDPYCPHLGAHLGHGGRVVGDALRCPFHGWCFDGGGRCVSVPRVASPPRVAISTWHLREVNGVIYVYHHAQGAAPDWEVAPVEVEGWTPERRTQWRVRTHPQEVIENGFDVAHFSTLHGMGEMEVVRRPSEEGAVMRMRLGYDVDVEGGEDERIEVEVAIHGLGIVNIVTEAMRAGFRDRQRMFLTPIDGESIDLRAALCIQPLPDTSATEQTAQEMYDAYRAVVDADIPVWEHKRYVEHPPLSRGDGPIRAFRTWARGFYGA